MKQVEKLAQDYLLNLKDDLYDIREDHDTSYEAGFRKALELVIEYLKEQNPDYLFNHILILNNLYDIKSIADEEVE